MGRGVPLACEKVDRQELLMAKKSFSKMVIADTELSTFLFDLMDKHDITYDQLMYIVSKRLHELLSTHIREE